MDYSAGIERSYFLGRILLSAMRKLTKRELTEKEKKRAAENWVFSDEERRWGRIGLESAVRKSYSTTAEGNFMVEVAQKEREAWDTKAPWLTCSTIRYHYNVQGLLVRKEDFGSSQSNPTIREYSPGSFIGRRVKAV